MKSVLITGGSSGIGLVMSKRWANNGYRILWISNNREELQTSRQQLESEIQNIEIHTLEKDLTHDNAATEIMDWSSNIATIDVLINNAGLGTYGYVENIGIDKELSMIKLNVLGLYKMTRLYLEKMCQRNDGTIINICSNSAFQPTPRMTTYAATKGFVYQFSRGLQEELEIRKSKVKVVTVCPAAIRDTPFRDLLSQEVKTFSGLATTTASEVADDVWQGFQKGKTFIISGRKMRWLYRISGLIPYSIQQYMVRKETERV